MAKHLDSNIEDEQRSAFRNHNNNNSRNNSNPSFNHFNINNNNSSSNNERLSGGVSTDKDGLVIPRKPANPCLESMEHREIHRELKFHLKTGKTVLNQKSELQKAMQKHRETQSRKEMEQERMSSRSALEITLEQRARRLEQLERGYGDDSQIQKSSEQNEFLKMHAKLRGVRVERATAIP